MAGGLFLGKFDRVTSRASGRAAPLGACRQASRRRPSLRQPEVERSLRRVVAPVRALVYLLAAQAGASRPNQILWIDGLADRISCESLVAAHEFRGLRPVAVAIGLQLDGVAVGIDVVEGHSQSVIETAGRLDALSAKP